MIWIYLLFALLSTRTQQWLPKIVWTYWQSGIQANNHKFWLYDHNHRKMLGNQWEIRLLNQTSVWQWLNQIPDFGNVLNTTQFKHTRKTNRANLIRISLIKHFGGVWMDYTTILIQGFDWLQNIHQSKILNNQNGEHPDMLFCTQDPIQKKSAFHDIQTDSIFYVQPDIQTFFIAAIPQAKLAIDVYNYYKKGHFAEKTYDKDGKEQNYFVKNALKNNYPMGHYGADSYFQFALSFQSVIGQKQRLFDKNWSGSLIQPRQLAVKYYNIWTMPSQKSSYSLQWIDDYKQGDHQMIENKTKDYKLHFRIFPINIIMQSDIDDLKRQKLYPNYLIKLSSGNRYQFDQYFIIEQQKKKLACEDQMYILQNSIVYKFMIEDYPVKFYANNILKYSFNRDCNLPIDDMKIKQRLQTFLGIKKVLTILSCALVIGISLLSYFLYSKTKNKYLLKLNAEDSAVNSFINNS